MKIEKDTADLNIENIQPDPPLLVSSILANPALGSKSIHLSPKWSPGKTSSEIFLQFAGKLTSFKEASTDTWDKEYALVSSYSL